MRGDSVIYLAECYFHQDYDVEFDTPDGVLRGFALAEGSATVGELSADLDDLLRDGLTDAELQSIWNSRGIAAYDPTAHGMTYREWFEHIGEVLNAGSLG